MSGSSKVRNKIDKLSGRARQAFGEAIGDRRMAGEGRRRQLASDVRGAGEKLKDALRSGRGRRRTVR
ncbi:CsbD family protein [Nocardia jejuensis]|uniref:CsbD family protein n=1 Tax=Nocardia jejuensis TaxID=328049 RepID=UPI0009FC0C99|nr:CsbD family protein [Nocardia jejuensis]